jgi:8-oxo-dGTP diphosphatase
MKAIKKTNGHTNEVSDYFKAGISIDCVVFGYDPPHLKILCIESDFEGFQGMKSLVGDLVYPYENLYDAAYRILNERTGLEDIHLQQVGAFGDPDRHPFGRVISIAYYALIDLAKSNLDTALPLKPSWINVDAIPNLAFDHNSILKNSINKLRRDFLRKQEWSNLMPEKFTLSELQTLIEAVLGYKMDKRNFRKKMLQSGNLKDLNRVQDNVAHRPAKLFKYKPNKKESLRVNV